MDLPRTTDPTSTRTHTHVCVCVCVRVCVCVCVSVCVCAPVTAAHLIRAQVLQMSVFHSFKGGISWGEDSVGTWQIHHRRQVRFLQSEGAW